MKNKLVAIFQRSFFFYGLVAGMLYFLIDHNQLDMVILNYLRDSARYMNRFSEGQEPFIEKQFVDTALYYEKFASIVEDKGFYYGMLGYCYYHLKNLPKAIAYYQKAIEAAPRFYGYYYNLAVIYAKMEAWDSVHDILKKAPTIEKDRSLAYYTLTSQHIANENIRSIWINDKMLQIKKFYDEGTVLFVRADWALKKYDESFAVASKHLRDDIDGKDRLYYWAGRSAFSMEKYEAAVVYFNEAMKLNKNFYEASLALSETFEKLGRTRESQEYGMMSELLKQMGYKEQFVAKPNKLVCYIPLTELSTRN